MPDRRTVYITDDGTNVAFFKFVADKPGVLSAGGCAAGGTGGCRARSFAAAWAGSLACRHIGEATLRPMGRRGCSPSLPALQAACMPPSSPRPATLAAVASTLTGSCWARVRGGQAWAACMGPPACCAAPGGHVCPMCLRAACCFPTPPSPPFRQEWRAQGTGRVHQVLRHLRDRSAQLLLPLPLELPRCCRLSGRRRWFGGMISTKPCRRHLPLIRKRCASQLQR